MASNSVQFRGVDSVMKAYSNRGVDAWSLWQGKQFMFKGEGEEELQAVLDLLKESSNAIYTLKIYEDVTLKNIKSNTPDDGSFNFKLNNDEQLITQNQYASLKYSNDLREEVKELKETIAAMQEEEEEEPNRLGFIGEVLGNPVLAPIVTQVLQTLLAPKSANNTTPQQPNVVPMQNTLRPAAINGIDEDAQIQQSVNELKTFDSKLAEHLSKLVNIAKESPQSFQFLLSTLDNL